MRVTSLGFRTDLMVRRLAGSALEDRGEYLVVRTPANPGFWWGNFVLFPHPATPGDGAWWEALFSTEFPEAAHRAFGIDGVCGATGVADELAALGLAAEVSTVLTATELAEPPAPAAAVRRLVGAQDWVQLLALRLACDDQPDSAAFQLFGGRRVEEAASLSQAGHGAWFGAFRDGLLVAGLGIVSDGFGVGRYQDVGTHPQHRRRGLARRLLWAAAGFAGTELGVRTLVIVADPGYHAIDLYRSLGFADAERQVQFQAG